MSNVHFLNMPGPPNDDGGASSGGADPPNIPPMGPGDHDRITKLEAQYDTLKVVRPMTIAVISIFLAAVALSYTVLIGQLSSLSSRVDAIPTVLREEFGRMRAEMAAQTSAIASSITAAKQTPPQVIFMPAPQPAPEPPKQ